MNPAATDGDWNRRLILLFALIARLVAYCFTDGFVWEDEYFQSLEPAHSIAFGHGVLTWEWEDGLRTWVIPYGYAALFRLAHLLGASGSGELVRVAQLVNLGLSLLVVDAAWRIANALAGPRVARAAGIVAAVFPALLFYAPRTLLDCPSAELLVWGYARFLEARRGQEAERAYFGVGFGFGLAYLFRYTAPIFFLGPGLELLACRRWRALAWLGAGFATVAMIIGLVDWPTWGAPFHSVKEFMTFNAVSGKNARFGVQPREWYVDQLLNQLGPASLVTIAVMVIGAQGTGGVGFGLLLGMSAMSLIEHKEGRFMLPIWAMAPPLLTLGAWRLTIWRQRPRDLAAAALVLAGLASHALVSLRSDWRPHGSWIQSMRYVGRQADLQGILSDQSCLELGGYVLLRRPVPIVTTDFVANPGEARELLQNQLLNYLVIDRRSLAVLPDLAARDSFDVVARFGEVAVVRRKANDHPGL